MSKRERDAHRKFVERISEGYHRTESLTPPEDLQEEYRQLLLAKAFDTLEDNSRLLELKGILDQLKSESQ
jgi:hypothetical protein